MDFGFDLENERNRSEETLEKGLGFDKWKSLNHVLIESSDDSQVNALMEAIRANDSLEIRYFGGTEPLRQRTIIPRALFRVESFEQHAYLKAWCHLRGMERTFRVDRIKILRSIPALITTQVRSEEVIPYGRARSLSLSIRIDLAGIESLDAFQELIANKLEMPVFGGDDFTPFHTVLAERFDEINIHFFHGAQLDKPLQDIIHRYAVSLGKKAEHGHACICVYYHG